MSKNKSIIFLKKCGGVKLVTVSKKTNGFAIIRQLILVNTSNLDKSPNKKVIGGSHEGLWHERLKSKSKRT